MAGHSYNTAQNILKNWFIHRELVMNPGKRQSRKQRGQDLDPGFRLDCQRPCTSFDFHSYTLHELRNRSVYIA